MGNNNIIPNFDDVQDESLLIKLETTAPHQVVIYLNGYIDTYNSPFFQSKVQKTLDAGFIHLTFNCGALNYLSSTGVAVLAQFSKEAKSLGGEVTLTEVQANIHEGLQLLGFSKFFTIK